MNSFRQWLKSQKQSPGSIRSHLYNIKVFQAWLADQYLEAKLIKQSDILAYLQQRRQSGNQNRTLAHHLQSIRKYFECLQVSPNPTLHLQIKGITSTIPSGLLSEKDLQYIYEKYPQTNASQKRNKVILSLLIYQAITTGELRKIQLADLNLKNEIIEVPSSRRSSPRQLKLQVIQLPLLKEYIEQIRPTLVQKPSKSLIINKENIQIRSSINRVIEQLKKRHPKFKNAQQLRASRIVLWLKQYNLRQVQYMAGHRFISSTEKYQRNKVEDLQKQLGKYHPLG